MRFQCIVATRKNPLGAAAVIQILHALSSGDHQIDYVVSYDLDDLETNHFFQDLKSNPSARAPRIRTMSDKAPLGVGAVWNRAVDPTADYICPMADDAFPATPEWDRLVHDTFEESQCPEPIRVMAWNDIANQNQCSLPIISRGWYEHAGLYDDRFPFWFYDTIVDEVWSFVVGRKVIIPPPLVLSSRKGLTKSLRDVPFWWSYYVALRPERVEKARRIREKMGIDLPPWKIADVQRMWERRDAEGAAQFDGYAKMTAEQGPPSERYIQAHALAAAHMLEMGAVRYIETARIVEAAHA